MVSEEIIRKLAAECRAEMRPGELDCSTRDGQIELAKRATVSVLEWVLEMDNPLTRMFQIAIVEPEGEDAENHS